MCRLFSLWSGILYLNTFSIFLILYLNVWIRIHKSPEYGSNTDPDPQHWFKLKYGFLTKSFNALFT